MIYVFRAPGPCIVAGPTPTSRLEGGTWASETTETPAAIADTDLLDIAVEELQIISFDECQNKGINYISAPVICPEGEVSFEMLMSGFPLDMQDQSFSGLAERLVLAADAVTRSIRGKKPSAS